jgi:transposase
MEISEQKSRRDNMIVLLEKTKAEVAKFRAELSGEKEQVEQKYEGVREELKIVIGQMNDLLEHNVEVTREQAQALREKVSDLELQLGASAMEIAKDFKAHIKVVSNSLRNVAMQINPDGAFSRKWARVHDRLLRSRIKLEILRLKLKLGRMDLKDLGTARKQEIQAKINQVKNYWRGQETAIEGGWKKFREELEDTYSRIQHAFMEN